MNEKFKTFLYDLGCAIAIALFVAGVLIFGWNVL